MYRQWVLTVGLGAVMALLVARADEKANLKVDPGLWEVTSQAKLGGDMEIPPDAMANMTPEQREHLQAAVQGMIANAQQQHVFKQCMTREKLAQGFKTGDEPSCKTTIVRNTAEELVVRNECAGDTNSHTVTAQFKALDHHHVNGTTDVVGSLNGKTMSMHGTMDAKWLSADCGSVKDYQKVR